MKSQVNSTFVNVLVIAFFLIIIVVFFSRAGVFVDRRVTEDTCRISAIAQANSRVLENPMLHLKCPRKVITIEDKGIRSYFAGEEVTESDLVYDHVFKEGEDKKKTITKLFADEMASCWYKMGEGKLNLFNRNWVNYNFPCLICSQIKFSDDFKMDDADFGTVREFEQYLKDKNYTKYGIQDTYHDFMYSQYDTVYTSWVLESLIFRTSDGDKSVQFYLDGGAERITADNYLIYFKGFKQTKDERFIWKGLSLLMENLPDGDHYYVFFTQNDRITQDCTMIVN